MRKKERSLLETPNQQTIDDIAAYCGVEVNRAMKALALKADGEFYLVLMRGNDQLNDIKFYESYRDFLKLRWLLNKKLKK